MTSTVKCIYIDAARRDLYFVERDVPVSEFLAEIPGYQKSMIATDPFLRPKDRHQGVEHALYYKEGLADDPADIPRTGFLWQTSHNWDEPFDPLRDNFTPICGNALLVSFNYNLDKGIQEKSKYAIPCDVQLSLEAARKMVPEFTDGILWKLPEFTCILDESFSEGGYELLLRVENESVLHLQYHYELTKPIRMLSPQIINFAFNYDEITVVTGKIDDLKQKARVVIYETDRADLRQIAACTLAAEKIPHWIQDRLRDYFFERMVGEPFRKKHSRKSGKHFSQLIPGENTSEHL